MSEEKEKLCELCEGEPATVLCAECFRCYCDECSKFVHKKSPKKEHKTETIPEGVKVSAMCPIHKTELKLFSVGEVELCCFECKEEKTSKGHTVVETSKISRDNEVFSAKNVKTLFGTAFKNGMELDKRIEKVIESIKEERKDVDARIEKSFNEARRRLDEEEKGLKEKLEKVTQEYVSVLCETLTGLRETHEYSKVLNEADSKGKDMSRLMELNLVSEMERQRRIAEEVHATKMTGVNIGWDSEERKLSFTKYIFNGVPTPGDLVLSNVASRRFALAWDCDESEMSEEDKEALSYVVEVKKSSDDAWKEAYSGKGRKCVLDNVDVDTDYDVHVKCMIGDTDGMWSDVAHVKTAGSVVMDSLILKAETNEKVLKDKLGEWCKGIDFELLYRGSIDGFGATHFHELCNDEGRTLTLVKNSSGHVFGGFTSVPWTSTKKCKQAPGSFLFTLTNMYGIQPTKFHLKNKKDGNAIYHRSDYGPTFGNGHDLHISSNCNANTDSYASFFSYIDTTGKGSSIFSSNTSDVHFRVQEIEVFKI